MTTQLDIERYLDDWLGSLSAPDADRVLRGVAKRVERQAQRPAWRFRWGFDHPGAAAAWAASLAATLVAIAVLATVTSGPQPTPQPSVDASPTDIAQATSTPRPTGDGVSIPIEPGEHRTHLFSQPFNYTVPEDWWLSYDVAERVRLSQGGPLNADTIMVLVNVAAAPLGRDGCIDAVDPGAQAAASVLGVLANADAVTADFSEVVVGGMWGYRAEISIDGSWEATCGDEGFGPGKVRTTAYPLAVSLKDGVVDTLPETAEAGSQLTLYVLEVGDGRLALIEVRGSDSFRAASQSIVELFDFRGGPGVLSYLPSIPPMLPLESGTHQTELFAQRFNYTVPTGWAVGVDDTSAFTLERLGGTSSVELSYDIHPATDGCMPRDLSDLYVPHSPRDLIAELSSRPGVRTTVDETEVGGFPAWSVHVRRDPDLAPPTCGEDAPGDVIYIVFWSDGVPLGHGGIPQSFTIIEGTGGKVLALNVYDWDDDQAFTDEAAEIIASIDFLR